ncbi:MAG: hypothetical protein OEW12_07605 [Deltaproteobacteria bacterium]|nr:hypothetical protein [Deltaproteobacteria bacterium]
MNAQSGAPRLFFGKTATVFLALTVSATPALAAKKAAPDKQAAAKPAQESSAADSENTFSISLEIGAGYDSNVYRTNANPYVDYYQGGVLVNPKVQSGYFIPVTFKAEKKTESANDNYFLMSYKFDGDFYTQKDFQNANQYSHMVNIGGGSVFDSQDSREDGVYYGLFLGRKKKIYYDRDNGDVKSTSKGASVSDRYTYSTTGLEAAYNKDTGDFVYGVGAALENRDYETPNSGSEYDYGSTSVNGKAGYYLLKSTLFQVSLDQEDIQYSKRNARLATASLKKTNPLLHYIYQTTDVMLKQSFGGGMLAILNYEVKERMDMNVGYNDFTRNRARVRFTARMDEIWKIRLEGASFETDYPNAFAFDTPGQEKKYIKGVESNVSAEYAADKTMAYEAGFKTWDEKTNDLRFQYVRQQAWAGMKLSF